MGLMLFALVCGALWVAYRVGYDRGHAAGFGRGHRLGTLFGDVESVEIAERGHGSFEVVS